MTTTPTSRMTMACVQKAYAEFDDSMLFAYLADGSMHVDKLRKIGVDIDTESIPVLVGIDWHGDHKRCAQVHLPESLDVDNEEGHPKYQPHYDRLPIIEAAISALERTRELILRTNGAL